jgi:hypothetical protein
MMPSLTDREVCHTLFFMIREFTPLNKHYDFGLGAMADAFEEAAECIEKAAEEHRFLNWALPVCFLRRHAMELFLKSMLAILDRRFGGLTGLDEIKVPIKGKPQSLTTVHSIGALYEGLRSKFALYESEWRPLCKTGWLNFPPELDAWILEIEAEDARGTFFRYPDSKDQQGNEAKSMFQESSVDQILASMAHHSIPRITALIANQEDVVTEVYVENRDVLARQLSTLRDATSLLSAANFGLRTELTGGR